jgi:DNA mismatch repair ATPase MutL
MELPQGITEKKFKRFQKFQRNLLVAFKASPLRAYDTAVKLEILISKKPQLKEYVSEEVASVLNIVKKEYSAKQFQVSNGDFSDDDDAAADDDDQFQISPNAHAASSSSSNFLAVSSGVVTLADLLKKQPKKQKQQPAASPSKKPPSICQLEETPEERQRRLARYICICICI